MYDTIERMIKTRQVNDEEIRRQSVDAVAMKILCDSTAEDLRRQLYALALEEADGDEEKAQKLFRIYTRLTFGASQEREDKEKGQTND